MRKILLNGALVAALAAGVSSTALAQACPPGYAWGGTGCYAAPAYPGTAYAPGNPVSGAATGAAAGAAAGGAAAGPVGAIVGGALGTATGTVAGTTNMVTGAPVASYPTYGSSAPAPAPACGPGFVFYNGACYPR